VYNPSFRPGKKLSIWLPFTVQDTSIVSGVVDTASQATVISWELCEQWTGPPPVVEERILPVLISAGRASELPMFDERAHVVSVLGARVLAQAEPVTHIPQSAVRVHVASPPIASMHSAEEGAGTATEELHAGDASLRGHSVRQVLHACGEANAVMTCSRWRIELVISA
jgi:hypothetical protein